jgi:tetratricopeptide (TPR) repeat protein
LLARVGLAWSRGFFSQTGQVDTTFVAVLREALDRPAELPLALRARATAALAAELTWAPDGDERFALSDTALALARSADDPSVLAAVLAARNLTVAAADTLDARRADTSELLDLVSGIDDTGLRFDALFHRCGPAIEDGDVDLIERLLAEAGQMADELRQPALQWTIGWSRASLLLWQGALAPAEKLATESAESGAAAGHASEAAMFLGRQVLEIRRLQGRLDELGPVLGAVPLGTPTAVSVARYLLDAGRADAAVAHLDSAGVLRDGRLVLRRDMLERPSLDELAHIAARLGRRDIADAVRARLAPLAGTFGHGVVAHPVGHHWLGVSARAAGMPEEALAHLRRAVAVHAELELPVMEAESRLELATAYEELGERDAAAEERAAARRIATAHGAAGLVAQADRRGSEGDRP